MTQHNIRTTELDPDLLTTPYAVQTNWHVLTGAACSGKTTLIDLLAEKGYQTTPETARMFIDRELAVGRPLEDIFKDPASEPCIIEMQSKIEHGLQANDIVFLDRGLPDSLTFCRFVGLNPNDILAECFHYQYASVFILDQLPFQLNGARIKDDVFTDLQEEWLVRDYSALGYSVVRVPVLSPEERLAFILDRISKKTAIG